MEQERCVGCEACIDTACGRDECPKGWPKAAQPEQEPVAWLDVEGNGIPVPVYTTPPQRTWVGLTKDQMLEILKEIDPETQRLPIGFRMFADAIEAKLKEKNT